MVNEFAVRADVARIESLEASPLHKTRMLLGVARRLRPAVARLSMLGEHHRRAGDPLRAARFHEATLRLGSLGDDVRARAAETLRAGSTRLGFGYAPRPAAYPTWSVEKQDAA